MNVPFVKQVDERGVVVNLSKDKPYINSSPNRRERRSYNKGRFRGNNKGYSVVVLGNQLYFKTLQRIPIFDDNDKIIGFKTVFHSNPKK